MEQVGIEFAIITDKANSSTLNLSESVSKLDSIISSSKESAEILMNKLSATGPIESLSDSIEEANENVNQLNISVLDLVKAQLIADAIKGIFGSIVSGIKGAVPEIDETFNRIKTVISESFNEPIKTIGESIIPLLEELENFVNENIDVFRLFGGVVANAFNIVIEVIKYTVQLMTVLYENTFVKLFGGIGELAIKASEYLNFTLLKLAFLFTAISIIIEPILETIGEKIVWVFQEIGVPIVNKFIDVISFLSDALDDPIKALDDFNTSTIVLASGGIALLGIGVALLAKSMITSLIPAIVSAKVSAWAFTKAILANPITWIVLGVMALVGAIVILYKNWDDITNFFSESIDYISNAFSVMVNEVVGYFDSIYESVSNIFTSIKNTIIESISNAIDFVMSYINPFIEKISSMYSKVSSVKDLFFGDESEGESGPTPKTDNSNISKNANIRNETTIENKNTYNIQSSQPEEVAKEIEKLETRKSKLTAKQEYNKYAPAMGYY